MLVYQGPGGSAAASTTAPEVATCSSLKRRSVACSDTSAERIWAAVGAPLAGARVTLAGPVSFGCPDGVAGVGCASVEVAAAPPGAAWPAVGSTACGWAAGSVPVAVEDALVDDRAVGRVRFVWTVAEGRCAVPEVRW